MTMTRPKEGDRAEETEAPETKEGLLRSRKIKTEKRKREDAPRLKTR
jgi:hypothetical protein